MQIFTAPVNDPDLNNPDFVKVFLAGTIDLGNSEDWQKMLIEKISENFSGKPIKIFNPRRESFPDISDTVEVERQILWELDALNVADIIFFGILGNSKSPITLLELGMMMGKNCKRNQIIVFLST